MTDELKMIVSWLLALVLSVRIQVAPSDMICIRADW